MIIKRKRAIYVHFMVLIGILMVNPQVLGQTTVHPGESIMDAMSEAGPGDQIFVQPGTYIENVILTAGVRLWSTSPDNTLIQASNSAEPTILMNQVNPTGFNNAVTEISGFKITGGNIGVKVDIADSQHRRPAYVVISGNWITENEQFGIDLKVLDGGPHYIVNNLVTRHRDCGIRVNSRTHVINNTVDRNGLEGDGVYRIADGISFLDNADNSSLSNNIISNNEGRGLALFYFNSLHVIVNPIQSNNIYGSGTADVDAGDSYQIIGFNGNISQDPHFIGTTPIDPFDYQPAANSPCRDSGTNSAYDSERFPLDLTQSTGGRIYPADGGTIDMGAVEYNPNPFGIPNPTFTPTQSPTPTSTPTAPVSADLNKDGYINSKDLYLFMNQWQSITPTPNP